MAYKQGILTSATPWRNGQADTVQKDGYEAVLRALVTQVAGMTEITSVARSGGSGQIDNLCGGVGAPAETWTVTFSDATNFNVTGSVSGSQAAGTVGSNYKTNGTTLTALLQFKITGSFSGGNSYTIVVGAPVTAAADRWILDRWDPNQDLSDVDEALIWHGPGDGTQAIYAGIRLYPDADSSIWNWALRGYTGFSSSDDFDNQPGVNSIAFDMSSWNGDCKFWIANNSRRYICVTNASSRYFSCYQGLILPFGSPNEYPYPLFICGTRHTPTSHTSDLDINAWAGFSQPLWNSLNYYNGELRDINGEWVKYANGQSLTRVQGWPNGETAGLPGNMWEHVQNLPPAGDHQLIPLMLVTAQNDINSPLGSFPWGVLDGAMAVTGFGNSPETVLNVSGTNWVCFGETYNVGQGDFYAVEMA